MCLKFAKQCLKLNKMKGYFPKNKRSSEFYKVSKVQTERFRKSAIPSMVKMLNDYEREKKETFNKLNAVPVNHACIGLYRCDNNKQK